MSTTTEALPREAIFEPDGHLTEVALTCVADGELSLVPSAALAHLDACEHCTRLLGEAALLSVAAEEALVTGAPEVSTALAPAAAAVVSPAPQVHVAPPETPRRARPPLPIAAIAAALLIALVTTAPSLVEGVREAPGTISAAAGGLAFMFRLASAVARAPWGMAALFVKCASALVLAAIGLQVARVTSRSSSLQEGGV